MKHKHKKRSHKEESSDSSASSSDESPPRQHKKRKDSAKKSAKHSRQSSSPERHKKSEKRDRRSEKHVKGSERTEEHKRKERDHHESQGTAKRKEKHKRDKSPQTKIKKEEDFDRRQDELSRKRRDRRSPPRRMPDVRIKQEPGTGEERRHRDDRRRDQEHRHRDSRDHHDGQRDEIERERRANDARRAEAWEQREREGGGNAEALVADTEEPKEKEKPNLGLSGALTEDTNTFRGVVIKYSEPPEARVPKKKWRLYPFKGDETLKVLHLHRQSAYLLGRLRRIADIPIDHPSCSKQHAVFQFRLVEEERADGSKRRIVKPYIIDLESANGTFLNNQQIEAKRYIELKEQDVIKFGFSSREYVLIHDKSDTTEVQSSGSGSDSD